MDLPVFIYSDKRSGLNFLSRQIRCLGQLSMWLQISQLNTTQIEPYRALVWSGIELSRSTDHQELQIDIWVHYLVVSGTHAVRPTTPGEHIHVGSQN